MSVVPSAEWYCTLLEAVQVQQAGILDRLGRPWVQHFERVALRIIFRNPAASRGQVEAALLHDAFMDRGGGEAVLAKLGVTSEAMEIIRLTTPPPAADFFRKFEAIGSDECALYLDYIRELVASNKKPAIEMKLADISDTIDACRTGGTDVQIIQYRERYEPSRRLLEAALSSLI